MRAIEQGVFTASTKTRLEELERDIELIKSKIETERIKQQSVATKDDYAEFLHQFIAKQVRNDDFKESIFQLLVRQVVLFRDKVRITFNFTPDGGKRGSDDDIEADIELKEAQEQYDSGSESSDLSPNAPPTKKDRFNPVLFALKK